MLVEKMYYSTVLMVGLLCCICTALDLVSNPVIAPSVGDPVQMVYRWPKGTWVENLATRDNGEVLVTRLGSNELYALDFESGDAQPTVVYRFPDVQALTGIAEIAPNVFAVIAGNVTFRGPTPGSWTVWRLDLTDWDLRMGSHTQPLAVSKVSKIADITEVAYAKGMTQLSDQYLLVSDFAAGAVYRLDVNTGAYKVVVRDSLMAAVPNEYYPLAGVNALQVRDGDLYFTNRGQKIFAKIPINADGTPSGVASVVARPQNPTDFFYGFTFGAHGDIYIGTGAGNTVLKLDPSGGSPVTIAGRPDAMMLAGPTNFAFGRGPEDKGVLYVATTGGLGGPVHGYYWIGGAVVLINAEN